MSIIVQLYLTFFKIGLFGFGGGYVMISLIQQEITSRGWLTANEFIDLIAIAQMTPGPIAINSATFIGYKLGATIGAFVATLGVITPSFILVIILARLLHKLGDAPLVLNVVKYLRPVIVGLIITAAWSVGQQSLGDAVSLVIGSAVLLALLFTKAHPILLIVLSGIIGIAIY